MKRSTVRIRRWLGVFRQLLPGQQTTGIRALGRLLIAVALIAAFIFLVQIFGHVDAAPADLDPTFGNGGKVMTGIGTVDQAEGMAIQPDRKIVVVATYNTSRTALLRYNPDGTLDEGFGAGGVVILDDVWARRIVIQPDGKFILPGRVIINQTQRPGVARLNSDGTPDNSFGNGGKATFSITGNNENVGVALLQPDGKIVLGGGYTWFLGGGSFVRGEFLLVRFNSDGTLDTSFGTGGGQTITWGGPFINTVVSLAQQSDGKILAVGKHSPGSSQTNVALARCNSDGSLDSGFGSGGKASVNFEGSDQASEVLVQPDGKLVVVATSSMFRFALARFDTNGSLDLAFGSNGKVITSLNTFTFANAAAIQPDGKVVVGGTTGPNFEDRNGELALARYNSDGSLDPAFGSGGKRTIDFMGDYDAASAVAVQPDGKIVAAGYASENANLRKIGLVRLLGDAVPRSISGRVTGNNGNGLSGVTLTLSGSQADTTQTDTNGSYAFNNVVSGGTYTVTPTLTGQNFSPASRTFNNLSASQIADFTTQGPPTPTPTPLPSPTPSSSPHADGNLDVTFGSGGRVITDFFNSIDSAAGIKMQPDGKIVVAGTVFNNSSYDFALARYQSDGSLDTSFGNGGKVVTDFHGSIDVAQALVIQPDGKIIVAGSAYQNATVEDFAIARYNSNGSLDSSFGSGGKLSTDFFHERDEVAALALQPDGKIIAVGSTYGGTSFGIPTSNDIGVARYNSNGSLDTTFGNAGKLNTDFSRGYDVGSAVGLQSDGKIVVAGTKYITSTSADFELARYNSNGSLDPSFGSNGKLETDFFGGSDAASDLVIQPDGRIIVAGSAFTTATKSDFTLSRYNINGSLDAGFGTAGLVTTDFSADHDRGYALALQSDGKILLAGQSFNAGTAADFALARYHANGAPDFNFGLSGRIFTDFSTFNNDAFAITIQSDGKIVLAGRAFSNNADYNFALARYVGSIPVPPGSGQTFSITGRVTNSVGAAIVGLSLSLSGSQMETTQTDGNGNYGFSNLAAGGNYRVEPATSSLTFDRASQFFFGLDANRTANFVGFTQQPTPTPTPTPLSVSAQVLINLDATGLSPSSFNVADRRFILQVKNVNWATLPPDIPLNLKDSQGNVIRMIVLPANGQAWASVVDLPAGTYTIVQVDNPSVTCTITVP